MNSDKVPAIRSLPVTVQHRSGSALNDALRIAGRDQQFVGFSRPSALANGVHAVHGGTRWFYLLHADTVNSLTVPARFYHDS